jgi:choice-of-anchor A domain-containing protein
VNGALGIGPSGHFHLSGGATLSATLYADTSATVQIDGGSALAGGILTQSMSALQAAAIALSNSASTLTPTQTFSQITSTLTITGNGGQNVIRVSGNFHLSGAQLTLSGGPSDTFIINAPGGMQLDGGAKIILMGISPSQVLFNFPGSGGQVQTSGNANTAGIFLAPMKQMQINGGVHNSEFISGGQLSFQSNPKVIAPVCPH